MNLSGNAVRYWLQKENILVENLLIVVDDLALPFGTLRLKPKGSDAGHNGLKNIAQFRHRQRFSTGRTDRLRAREISPGGIAIDARDIGSCDRDHQELLPRRHPDYDESI